MPVTTTKTPTVEPASPRAAPAPDVLGGAALGDPLEAPSAAPPAPAPANAGAPTLAGAPPPADGGADPLPLVQLPSRFKPAAFLQASNARGIRPRALKAIDDHLSAVDAAADPAARFAELTALQGVVDDYVFRYGKDNPRGQVTFALKQWVDGAVALRADRFRGAKPPK